MISGGQTAGAFCFAAGCTGTGVPGAGRQALTFRVFDQVEDTREKASQRVRLADIDDRRVRQFLAKNIKDQAARVLVEVIAGFVEHYPARLVQQEPDEGELVLVLAGQFLFPARVAIEVRRQMGELHPLQRGHVFLARELGGLGWISQARRATCQAVYSLVAR